MGMFDIVEVDGHFNEQTKALGKRGCTYHLGDRVQVVPAPTTEDLFELYITTGIPALSVPTFQVQTSSGWAIAQNNVLVGWLEEPFEGIPMYDYLGCLISDEVDDQFK